MKQYDAAISAVKPATQAQNVQPAKEPSQIPVTKPVYEPLLERMKELMGQVHDQASSVKVLDQLAELQSQSISPLQEELAFWKLRILLQYQHPSAMAEALSLIKSYPKHRLIPRTYLWIVKWQPNLSDQDILFFTSQAMQKSKYEKVVQEAIVLGESTAKISQPEQAVKWYLSAANADQSQRLYWLGKLSEVMTDALLVQLHKEGLLKNESGELLYVQMAKNALLSGKMADIQLLKGYLEQDHPSSEYHQAFVQWLKGTQQNTVIGVMLPLTGKYARYGQQSLRGVRLAVDSLDTYANVTLQVEDTGEDSIQCVRAYEHLMKADVIIGPLLSRCAQDISKDSRGDVPLISLSNRIQTAVNMPQMFLHSLSLQMQAKFMAQYALSQGHQRMVVIQMDSLSAQHEAEMFKQSFELGGGLVMDQITLSAMAIDYRGQLASLGVQRNSYDAIYLAVSGKMMSLLGGQMAIVGVSGIPYYGSSRWQDGHLLGDRGRYLSQAYFSDISFPIGDSPELASVLFLYHQIWPEEKPEKLLALAYDSTMIAVMVAARLGLRGEALMSGLQDPAGFDGLTGHVTFNREGIGEKSFEVFHIQGAEVVLHSFSLGKVEEPVFPVE